MLGHAPFDHQTLRKMTIYFGTVFNELNIFRKDSSDSEAYLMRVPLVYGPKDKNLLRTDDDPEIQREYAVQLPRMSYEFKSVVYDNARKTGTTRRVWVKDNNDYNKAKRMYNMVPYDYIYELNIYVKHFADGEKILGQIIPHFSPEWTATVNILPEITVRYSNCFTKRRIRRSL